MGRFAVKLAEWRKMQGWTQARLAQELGCKQPYISQIERAVNPLVPGTALMIEIYALTNGEVQPNDFYALPPADQQEAA